MLIYYRNTISCNVTENNRKHTVKVVDGSFEVLTRLTWDYPIGIHRGVATLSLRRHTRQVLVVIGVLVGYKPRHSSHSRMKEVCNISYVS